MTGKEPELVQAHSGVHSDRKGPGNHFQEQAPPVAGANVVKTRLKIGNGAGKDVHAPRSALGVCLPADLSGKRERFHQRDQVDATLFEHRALAQVDLIHQQFRQEIADGEALGDRPLLGQKTAEHPVGRLTKAEIEARRLILAFLDGRFARDDAFSNESPKLLGGENATRMSLEGLFPVR